MIFNCGYIRRSFNWEGDFNNKSLTYSHTYLHLHLPLLTLSHSCAVYKYQNQTQHPQEWMDGWLVGWIAGWIIVCCCLGLKDVIKLVMLSVIVVVSLQLYCICCYYCCNIANKPVYWCSKHKMKKKTVAT